MSRKPVVDQAYNAGDANPTPWVEARNRFKEDRTYWLSTTRPDGKPHAVPLLAVWVDESLHFVASAASRRTEHLAHNPNCVISTQSEPLDLVVEGTATKVIDDARPHRVAEAYSSKYSWPVDIRNGAFHAEGAPTTGPSPYEVYEVMPSVAFGFPHDETFTPTRWRFT